MRQKGLGVMINMLAGNKSSVEAYSHSVGKKIIAVKCVDDALCFTFSDGTRLYISDQGQSCCESRHMSCDDNLVAFAGAKFIEARIEAAPEFAQEDEDAIEYHEVQFLHVKTSKGSFAVQTHNEHNGYYGGFDIVCREEA